MIIINPSDPSIKFLNEIIETAKRTISCEIDKVMPEKYKTTLDLINSSHKSKTLLFLGHGFSEGLYGGCYVAEGKQVLLRKDKAEVLFKDKKVILFSCRSSEFIATFSETFEVAIGFGDIKTTKDDLTSKHDKKKYRDLNSIRIFRESLVNLFISSFVESSEMKYTFLEYYNSLKLRINKCICKFSLSEDPNERLAGELMFELKKEMILVGNSNALFNDSQK